MKPDELLRIYESIAGRQLLTPFSGTHNGTATAAKVQVFFKYSELVPETSPDAALKRYRDLISSVPIINALGIVAVINNVLSVEAGNPDTHRRLNAQFLSDALQRILAGQKLEGATPVIFNKQS